MRRVITAFPKETETISIFHIFPIIFHKFFQKLTRKCHKIAIEILENLYDVFPTFLQIFFTISLKFQRNIFNISL